jgi:hypothetical protein
MADANTPEGSSWFVRWPLLAITVAGIAIGVYARFKGLGTWPFGVDEFYLSRSVDYVLRSGLPEFPCGGYYTRGLLFQYVVAGLRLTGLEPELAGRLVTAFSSLAVLPAAYLLARRLHSTTAGLLVVTILALSVWEIEMARFARMYAPFQAVFAWYVLYFLKYTVDGQRSAMLGMVLLSILGVLTWEGGALMGLANLLPPFINHDAGRLRRRDWPYLGGMVLLFLMLYSAVAIDFRGFSGDPAYADIGGSGYLTGNESNDYSPRIMLGWHGAWILLALLPVGLSLISLRWLWSLRDRWLAASGLTLVLAAALLHQLAVAFFILVLVLLVKLVTWRELLDRRAISFSAALAACAVFWVTMGVFSNVWFGETTSTGLISTDKLIALSTNLAGFPYIWENVFKPLGRAIPLLSVCLFVAVSALTLRAIFCQKAQVTVMSAVLVLVLTMVLAVAASDTPREETRYVFFLYPVVLTLAIAAVALASASLTSNERRASAATIIVVLLAFVATEDFQPQHLLRIDSREVNFRVGMSAARAAHYYPRRDFRGLAQWLNAEAGEEDFVITGLSTLAQYHDDIDYVFLEKGDPLYRQYACHNGTIHRWTDLPLLYTTDALIPLVASGNRLILLLYPARARKLQQEAALRGWRSQEISLPTPGAGDVLIINPN